MLRVYKYAVDVNDCAECKLAEVHIICHLHFSHCFLLPTFSSLPSPLPPPKKKVLKILAEFREISVLSSVPSFFQFFFFLYGLKLVLAV